MFTDLVNRVREGFKKRPQPSPPQDVTLIASCIAILRDMSARSARKATHLALEGKSLEDAGNVFFNKMMNLDDEVYAIVQEAEQESPDGITPNWTEVRLSLLNSLQEEQLELAEQGATLQQQGAQHAKAADHYAQLVIELQVCIYEVRSLSPIEIQRAGDSLIEILDTVIEFFREREKELTTEA